MKELMEGIKAEFNTRYIGITEEQESYLKSKNAPDEIIEFYKLYCPEENIDSSVELLNFDGLTDENDELAPGHILSQNDFIVIAINGGGDSYCIDNRTLKILCFNHEENYQGLNRDAILKLSYPLYDSLELFLKELLNYNVPYDILDMDDW